MAALDLCSRLLPVAYCSGLIWNNLVFLREAWGREGAGALQFYVAAGERLSVVTLLCLFVVLFLVRSQPIRKASGILPRVVAMCGTMLMTTAVFFPRLEGHLLVSAAATALVLVGSCLSVVALCALRRSFSVMAEARSLVTAGPYRLVRHPLYASEQLAMFGVALQHLCPGVVAILALQTAFQLWRMRNEEAVLGSAFPEYEQYKARTARLIPGVY